MRILVLGGCGAIGTEVVRDLINNKDFTEIVVADLDLARTEKLVAELNDNRLKAITLNAADEAQLTSAFKGFNLVANCTTYHFGLSVTRAAIAAKVHYLDLGGLFNTPKQLEMDAAAQEAGVTICLGCGATPGVTNLCARAAADSMDQVDEVHIAFASYRSIAPSPGLLDTILDEFSPDSRRFYWQEGSFIEMPAFSGAKTVHFAEPVGDLEVYYVPHSETHTMPRFLGKGVKLVDVRGSWRKEIMDALRVFAHYHITGTNPVSFGEQKISPKDFLKALILQQQPSDNGRWGFLLNVEVLGQSDGRKVKQIFNTRHPDEAAWGHGATTKMTGIPAAVGAELLAKGLVTRRGVAAPEALFDPQTFFNELKKRGIYVSAQRIEEIDY